MDTTEEMDRVYPGIGRLGYFIGLIIICIVAGMFANGQRYEEPSMFPQLFALGSGTLLSMFRLENIGKSRWMALVTLVPLFNFVFVFFPGLVCQAGYEDNRTLDKPGRILLAVMAAFVLLIILSVIATFL